MTLIAQIRLIAAAQRFNDPDLGGGGASTPIMSHQDIEGFLVFVPQHWVPLP